MGPGVIVAIEATNALISVAMNGLIAAQKYQALITTARAEGRDVTDEELAALKAESDALTSATLANLGVTNGEQG